MNSIFEVNPTDYASIISSKSHTHSRRVVPRTGDASANGSGDDATFFVIGRVVHSQLKYHQTEKNRPAQYYCDVSLELIHRFLPRTIAVISKLLEFPNAVFAITHDGLSFSTMRKSFDGTKPTFSRDAAMNGVTHGPCMSPFLFPFHPNCVLTLFVLAPRPFNKDGEPPFTLSDLNV